MVEVMGDPAFTEYAKHAKAIQEGAKVPVERFEAAVAAIATCGAYVAKNAFRARKTTTVKGAKMRSVSDAQNLLRTQLRT